MSAYIRPGFFGIHGEGDAADVNAGGPYGGIWRSTNAGKTWTKMSKGLPPAGVDVGRISFAVDPKKPGRMYALIDGKCSVSECAGGRGGPGFFGSTAKEMRPPALTSAASPSPRSEEAGPTAASGTFADRALAVDERVHPARLLRIHGEGDAADVNAGGRQALRHLRPRLAGIRRTPDAAVRTAADHLADVTTPLIRARDHDVRILRVERDFR